MDSRFILKLAHEAIENFVKTKKVLSIPENYPKELADKKGVFVTIYKHITMNGIAGKVADGHRMLRGCIGLPYPEKPLVEGLIEAAISVCHDPRFEPLKEKELDDISIEVSVLGEPQELRILDRKKLPEILDRYYGYIIKKGIFSGLFLPQVWKELPEKQDFLEQLCLKAGLLSDAWLDPSTKIYKFSAEIFEE